MRQEELNNVIGKADPKLLGYVEGDYVVVIGDKNYQPYRVDKIKTRVVGDTEELDNHYRNYYKLKNGTPVNCVLNITRIDVGMKYEDNDTFTEGDIDAFWFEKADILVISGILAELNKKIAYAIEKSKVFTKILKVIE